MNTQLKAPGTLLREAWAIYRRSWKSFLGITIVPPILAAIGLVLFAGAASSGAFVYGVLGIIAFVAAVVVFIAAQVALIDAVRKSDAGQAYTVAEQYRFGFGLFWPLILLFIIQAVASIGSFTLLFIPGVIYVIYTSLYIFAFAVDGKRGLSAVHESYLLVRGRWWATLGRSVIVGIVCGVVTFVFHGAAFLISLLIPGYRQGFDSAFSYLATIVTTPFFIAYMYRFYLSLKETRDPAATGAAFRKWTIVFIVIGIILVLAGFGASIADFNQ